VRPRTVVLVARRELLGRVRTRAYALSTAALVVGVLFAVGAPHVLRDSQHRYDVGLAGHVAPGTAGALTAAARGTGDTIDIRRLPRDAVRAELERGAVQAVLVDGRRLVVRGEVDRRLQSLVEAAAVRVELAPLLDRLPRVTVTRLEPGGHGSARNVAYGSAILLYLALILAGSWVASGVVEEKSSRVVEVMLASVRAGELLAGKLLGIGLVALGQVLAATAAAATAGVALGSLDLPHGVPLAALTVVGWFAVGYALYACAFAAAASLVSRQEDVPAVTTPLNAVMIAGFLTAMTAAGQPDGPAARVLSLLPPFAPLLMPVRSVSGHLAAWEMPLALLLALASLAALVPIAAAVYAGSALHGGGRIPLRAILARRPSSP
jgi:ABC-2 type transport system permease protein